jgi:CubicO group peptidase (beta-lactamase class C family)
LVTRAPVDAHTLFEIASNTKAFTAASLEILADEGKLDMDAKVIKYLPWFRMSSKYVTYNMRVRDLLAHDSGLPLGQTTDVLFTPDSDYSGKEVAEHLADVPLGYSFRATSAYDNILLGVAALVVERVSGESYREFLKSHIFEPLGMDDTRFNYHYISPSDGDVALGYDEFGASRRLRVVEKMAWANAPGAAGIYSSAHDMAKWILAQIAGGVYGMSANGSVKRLFSEKSHKRMWTMQSIITPSKRDLRLESKIPELKAIAPDYQGFAEGWRLSQYHRYKMVMHTGGWPGFVSRVTIIPSAGLGIVVLTNQRSGGAFNAITNYVLDRYLNIPEKTDWIAVYTEAAKLERQHEEGKWRKVAAARDSSAGPSLSLGAYAGVYCSWYGKVRIADSKGKLDMAFTHTPALVGQLEHWSHDTFMVHWRDRLLKADAFVTFALTPTGKVDRAMMAKIPGVRSSDVFFSYEFNHLRLTPVSSKGSCAR